MLAEAARLDFLAWLAGERRAAAATVEAYASDVAGFLGFLTNHLGNEPALDDLAALRQADQIVLGHLMVDEKSNEIPAAPELIEALGLKGCLFTLDAEHCQKKDLPA